MTSSLSALFASDREADPPFRDGRAFRIFEWVGQPFDSCDNCGIPYWGHLYEPPTCGVKPLFRVKQWDEVRKAWAWKPVGRLITRERAEACRDKWQGREGYGWETADV